MIYVQKQANLSTLGANDIEAYVATTNAQIRAFTAHNPTDKNINLVVHINDLQIARKTIMPGGEIILSALFNQQLKPGDKLIVGGQGASLFITVTEIVD